MKSHKIALTLVLTTLIIIYGVLVEAEPQEIPFPTIKKSPPPIIPPPTPIIPPPTPIIPPPSNSTTVTLSTSASTSTTSSLPPPSSLVSSISPTPSSTPSTPPLTPSSTPPLTPSSSSPNPASPSDAAQSCSESNNICSDPKTFCHLSIGKCQPKGDLGDSCRKDNECLEPFVCNKNSCQYSDSGTANHQDDNHYNVKKVAIIGAIVVGVSGVCGLTFFMYRQFKKKNDYDITSRLYSTDDEMSEPDPYPFNERSNSFSNNNAVQPPPSRVSPKIHYDNLPPARNRAFAPPHQGYNNYYNNNNDGRYMRQNEPVTRTMNLLQQTRGNVVITPPQNYNWNPAVQQQQGGLFPIPSVKGNYGAPPVPPVPPVPFIPPSNNTNLNKNNNNNSAESSNRSQHKASSYSVDYSSNYNNDQTKAALKELKDSNTSSPNNVKFDQQKETQPLKDPSALSDSSNLKQKDNVPVYRDSIFDYYTRDSIFSKTLENKLPMFKRNKNNDEPAPEKKSTSTATASRIQTFGYDPKSLKSSTLEEKKVV